MERELIHIPHAGIGFSVKQNLAVYLISRQALAF